MKTSRQRCPMNRRAFTLRELLVGLLAAVALLSIVLPTVASGRNQSRIEQSMTNLMAIGFGQFLYSADWNGRQYAVAREELGFFGSNPTSALTYYDAQVGPHPGVWLGWNEDGLWYFPLHSLFIPGNASMVAPIEFNNDPFGNHRLVNVKPMHDYVSGRFYDSVYFAPNDRYPYKTAEPFFDLPDEYVPTQQAGGVYWSSYCFSAAARYNPDVFRAPSDGGFQDPFQLDYGLRTPLFTEVLYPDLKTMVMEHHWNQNPPNSCQPLKRGPYNGCKPYQFNHGMDSSPVTIFYDGHIRVLRNSEAFAADQQVLKQSGGVDGLWSRDTPFGAEGYNGDVSVDGTLLSHHTLTTNGIRGRDTLAEFGQ